MGPVAGDKSTVPADHCGGLDDQHYASEPLPVEGTREHSQDGAIGWGELGAFDLSLEDEDLVA